MEYAGKPRLKKSEDKATWPGRKQVFRAFKDGIMTGDVVTLEGAKEKGTPLLEPVMEKGRRISGRPGLPEIRAYAGKQIASLPSHLRQLDTRPAYPVRISPALDRLKVEAEKGLGLKT
jgi:nicotinate phosphoribosyltransferase